MVCTSTTDRQMQLLGGAANMAGTKKKKKNKEYRALLQKLD
jgi:hypothetical protein